MELQRNKVTGRVYEGGNQAELLKVKDREGYLSDEWLTFVQARDLGRKLVNAKGKGIGLRTFVEDHERNETTNKFETVHRPRHFVVFNSDLLEKEGK
jgi:antirestriction protein ArdC